MPTPDAIVALKELDPGQRALLDLSLNRELSDSLIAGLLDNVDESGVAGMRSEALADLARAARIDGPDAADEVERQLRSASDQQWLGAETNGNGAHAGGSGNAAASGEQAAPAAPAPRPRPSARPEPRRRKSSRRGWLLALLALALVAAVVLIVALAGGDDSDGGAAPTPLPEGRSDNAGPPPEGNGAPDPAPPAAAPVELEALPGAAASAGTATIAAAPTGDGYVLRLQGLPQPDGYYRLWLYDSLIDSAPLGGAASGDGNVPFELPADAEGFGALDLSVEDGAGDRIHSGRSVFRLPLADLPG